MGSSPFLAGSKSGITHKIFFMFHHRFCEQWESFLNLFKHFLRHNLLDVSRNILDEQMNQLV